YDVLPLLAAAPLLLRPVSALPLLLRACAPLLLLPFSWPPLLRAAALHQRAVAPLEIPALIVRLHLRFDVAFQPMFVRWWLRVTASSVHQNPSRVVSGRGCCPSPPLPDESWRQDLRLSDTCPLEIWPRPA